MNEWKVLFVQSREYTCNSNEWYFVDRKKGLLNVNVQNDVYVSAHC